MNALTNPAQRELNVLTLSAASAVSVRLDTRMQDQRMESAWTSTSAGEIMLAESTPNALICQDPTSVCVHQDFRDTVILIVKVRCLLIF